MSVQICRGHSPRPLSFFSLLFASKYGISSKINVQKNRRTTSKYEYINTNMEGLIHIQQLDPARDDRTRFENSVQFLAKMKMQGSFNEWDSMKLVYITRFMNVERKAKVFRSVADLEIINNSSQVSRTKLRGWVNERWPPKWSICTNKFFNERYL